MADTYQWNGGSIAYWNNEASWTLTAGAATLPYYPGIDDTADIPYVTYAIEVSNDDALTVLQTGTVDIATGNTVTFLGAYQFGSLTIGDTTSTAPTTIALYNSSSSIEVGTTGSAAGGTIDVASGHTLTADGYAALSGVVNAGTIEATHDTLTLNGSITNDGTILAAGGEVDIAGTLAAGLSGVLEAGSQGDLVISAAQPDAAELNLAYTGTGGLIEVGAFSASTPALTINGFGPGDALKLDGVNLQGDAVTYSSVNSTTGTLDELKVGSYTFQMNDTLGGISFGVLGIGLGSTSTTITGVAESDSYTYSGNGSNEDWSNPANWTDTNPDAGITSGPGTRNNATFNLSSAGARIDGGGAANVLTVNGPLELLAPSTGSTYSAQSLNVGAANSTVANSLTLSNYVTLSVANGTAIVDGTLTSAYGAKASFGKGLELSADGTASATLAASHGGTIDDGGNLVLDVASTGASVSVSVDSTSSIEVGTAGGAAAGAITVDAGAELLSSGSAGTAADLDGNVVNDGDISGDINSMVIAGNLSGSGTEYVGTDATLTLEGTAAAGNVIDLETGATLQIGAASANHPYAVAATLDGFTLGNGTIQLEDTTLSTAVYTAGSGGLGTLKLYDGSTVVETLTLNGNYTGDSFALSSSGGTASVVVESAVCYVRGTLIRTARGEVPIEHLRRGDRVIDSAGTYHPVQWLGHRRVDCTAAPHPREVWPIRVTAHAFGENLPDRDLYLSPGHSVRVGCIEEALVPIVHLINGATIARHPVEQVEYWHVELDEHAVILANNLPAESYIDMNNRDFFIDRGIREYKPAATVLPVQHSGPMVELARRQLRDRAQRLGWTHDKDPQPRLLVDGVEHALLLTEGDVAQFELPATARDVRLVSRTFVPADLTGGVGDGRVLGLSLHGIELRSGEQCLRIALDDERLENPHPVERDAERAWRWTDGSLRLAPELWSSLTADSLTLRIRFDSSALRGYLERNPAPAAACAGALRIASAANA